MSEKIIKSLKNLSLYKIKERVRKIKLDLPSEERKIITFSKNFTLSLSNYCQNICGYCFYNYKIPKLNGQTNVILLQNEQIGSSIQMALKYNCKEALVMSGERPEIFEEVKSELKKRNYNNYIDFIIIYV